ncbi:MULTISPECIES: hypothetical protein [Burkholderia]|uniref:Uncharacterized protein n=1 Tax=Burkholderia savannae TaxID=1637837 RepID=A0ABR5T2A4_9BURK|nr:MULTISPECIES: hypothetical protein [Burkholderia]AOJ72654.1 hypothetical protein WS78_28600 [Burkholderia savannae]AOJ84881.1 hypothetical protein WS86_30850 [Burkholderia savannae]AOK48959.1 hypothetical protein WT60_18400 [Burkholderia sp. MSMB617WGS]KGS02665.1 hypothetical protein X946_3303 [Burkholderia sp. ABCPW 111]KVG45113.1 hypothetical protein WS77_08155 [Burkholderia sp. MSMB0265]
MRELNYMETANVAGAWSWSDITTSSIMAMFRPASNAELTVREPPELTGGAAGLGDTFGKVAAALLVGGVLLAGGIGAGLLSLARR